MLMSLAPDSRNCGSVTAPRSSNTTSTGMPHDSSVPGGMSTRLVRIRKPGLFIQLDEDHDVGDAFDEAGVQWPLYLRVGVDARRGPSISASSNSSA